MMMNAADISNIVCCGGWGLFLGAVLIIIKLLNPSIQNYINTKAEEIRSRIKSG